MINLKDVTDDKCWPFNLPQFTASSIFIPDHWGLKCCINGRGAVQHYESTGQYIQKIFFYHSPSSRREVTLMRMCLYSVLFCLRRGTWKNVRLRQHALPGLHYAFSYHFPIVLFASQGDVTIGTKKKKMYLECSHFGEWIPVLLCRCVCRPVEM